MSNIRYMNQVNNPVQNGYIQEYANNELFTKKSGYTPLAYQQQQQQQLPNPINRLNIASYSNNVNPATMSNMNIPVIDEHNAVKKFNSNITRSNSSSSSTSSSVMSALSMHQNKFYHENSFCGNESDSDLLDVKHRNNLSKLFEDDFIYCPRSLLSKHDLQRADMLLYEQSVNHSYLVNSYNMLTIESPSSTTTNMHSTKFNPYTSKSFNPALSL